MRLNITGAFWLEWKWNVSHLVSDTGASCCYTSNNKGWAYNAAMTHFLADPLTQIRSMVFVIQQSADSWPLLVGFVRGALVHYRRDGMLAALIRFQCNLRHSDLSLTQNSAYSPPTATDCNWHWYSSVADHSRLSVTMAPSLLVQLDATMDIFAYIHVNDKKIWKFLFKQQFSFTQCPSNINEMKAHWFKSAFENRLRAGLVWHTMQTNPAVEPNKNIYLDGPRVRGISPVGKEKVCGGKDLNNITRCSMRKEIFTTIHMKTSRYKPVTQSSQW